MKKLILLSTIVLLIFVITSCKKKSTTDNTTNNELNENKTFDNLLPYEVENKITSETVSNKILAQISKDVLNWTNKEVIVNAVTQANIENAKRTQEQIDQLDKQWRAVKDTDGFIDKYLKNETADFLRDVQTQSKGLYAEIFVMDFQGCNVAMSNKTSDFWQGDEAKFKISYNDAKGKIFIDAIEFDESTKENLVQVSLPISNEAKEVIGAITIGMSIDKL